MWEFSEILGGGGLAGDLNVEWGIGLCRYHLGTLSGGPNWRRCGVCEKWRCDGRMVDGRNTCRDGVAVWSSRAAVRSDCIVDVTVPYSRNSKRRPRYRYIKGADLEIVKSSVIALRAIAIRTAARR